MPTRNVLIYSCLLLATACEHAAAPTPAPAAPTASATTPIASPAPVAETAPSASGGSAEPSERKIGMPNPSWKFCSDHGGKQEEQHEAAGDYMVCVFPDGSRCDGWAFFRGECAPGKCKANNGRCP